MAIVPYLAMTSAEWAAAASLPRKSAWMACHFSPYSTGLSNLPEEIPEGTLLILNDRTPIHGHDPERILAILTSAVDKFRCCGVLLDFQQPGIEETKTLVNILAERFPHPLVISQAYAAKGHPVFLPPVPTDITPEKYLAPWGGWEIWIEAALEGQTIQLMEHGAKSIPSPAETAEDCHRDERLHCHYNIRETEDAVDFHLYRTQEDLAALLAELEKMGVQNAVGLYQELG